jgi:hypothetical protein
LSNIHQRLLEVFQTMGWPDGALYLASHLIAFLSFDRLHLRKYYFVSQPLPVPELPKGRGHSIQVREIDRNHPEVPNFPRPRNVISRRFDDGSRCFLATKDDAFAGYLWLKSNGYDEDEVRCRFVPQPAHATVWDFDVFVPPELRNGLAFLRLWNAAGQDAAQDGFRYSVSRIAAFNPMSLASHARLGAFPIGSAYFLNGTRWQLLFSTSPTLRLSIGRSHTPELLLDATGNSSRHFRRFRQIAGR